MENKLHKSCFEIKSNHLGNLESQILQRNITERSLGILHIGNYKIKGDKSSSVSEDPFDAQCTIIKENPQEDISIYSTINDIIERMSITSIRFQISAKEKSLHSPKNCSSSVILDLGRQSNSSESLSESSKSHISLSDRRHNSANNRKTSTHFNNINYQIPSRIITEGVNSRVLKEDKKFWVCCNSKPKLNRPDHYSYWSTNFSLKSIIKNDSINKKKLRTMTYSTFNQTKQAKTHCNCLIY